jgi:hypothetical protein
MRRRAGRVGRIPAGNWTIQSKFALNKPFARGCVLAAVVCGALASPGLARAADPLGLGEVAGEVTGEMQSALAEADAVAPGTAAAAQPAVSQTAAAISSASAAASVPTAPAPSREPSAPPAASPASAPPEAGGGLEPLSAAPPTPLSGPASELSAAASAVDPLAIAAEEVRSAIEMALAPVFPDEPQHTAVASPARPSLSLLERAPSLPGDPRSRDASVVPAASVPVSAVALEAPRAAPAGTGSAARASSRGGGGDEAPAGAVVPQRPLPPAPPPERPDLSAPSQGGGQGPLMPLVLGALAAAFALFSFQRHARLLPRTAFRKPRRVVLPVWHPG